MIFIVFFLEMIKFCFEIVQGPCLGELRVQKVASSLRSYSL